MIYDILFVISILTILFCLTFGRMLLKSETEQCRYRLFKIRDELILLVANRKIQKDSIVFSYYYSFVNNLLRMTEHMHFEGLINALYLNKRSRQEIEEYDRHLKQVAEELKNSTNEALPIIVELYEILFQMLAINSNLFTVIYRFLRHHKISVVLKWLGWQRQSRAMEKACNDIEQERKQLGLPA